MSSNDVIIIEMTLFSASFYFHIDTCSKDAPECMQIDSCVDWFVCLCVFGVGILICHHMTESKRIVLTSDCWFDLHIRV